MTVLSVAMLPHTLSISQNLNLDFLEVSFWVQWTRAHGSAASFRGNEDLGKLGKEYLNDLLCKFGPFRLQHSMTFHILHAFLRVTIAELSKLKPVRFFLAYPGYCVGWDVKPYSLTHSLSDCRVITTHSLLLISRQQLSTDLSYDSYAVIVPIVQLFW